MALKYNGMANHFVTACTSLNDKRICHMAIESGYFVNGTRGYVFFLGLAEMKAAQRIAVHLLKQF